VIFLQPSRDGFNNNRIQTSTLFTGLMTVGSAADPRE